LPLICSIHIHNQYFSDEVLMKSHEYKTPPLLGLWQESYEVESGNFKEISILPARLPL